MTSSNISRRKILAGAAIATAAAPLAGSLAISPEAAKVPMAKVDHPTHRRFKLGEFDVTTINDGAINLENPQGIFGTNASKEDFEAQAKANFLPTDKLQTGCRSPVTTCRSRQSATSIKRLMADIIMCRCAINSTSRATWVQLNP